MRGQARARRTRLVGEGAGRNGSEASEAKVAELDGARGTDEDICGLHIAMEHSERMEVLQAAEQPLHIVLDSALGKGSLSALNAVCKRAYHAFHDDDEGRSVCKRIIVF